MKTQYSKTPKFVRGEVRSRHVPAALQNEEPLRIGRSSAGWKGSVAATKKEPFTGVGFVKTCFFFFFSAWLFNMFFINKCSYMFQTLLLKHAFMWEGNNQRNISTWWFSPLFDDQIQELTTSKFFKWVFSSSTEKLLVAAVMDLSGRSSNSIELVPKIFQQNWMSSFSKDVQIKITVKSQSLQICSNTPKTWKRSKIKSSKNFPRPTRPAVFEAHNVELVFAEKEKKDKTTSEGARDPGVNPRVGRTKTGGFWKMVGVFTMTNSGFNVWFTNKNKHGVCHDETDWWFQTRLPVQPIFANGRIQLTSQTLVSCSIPSNRERVGSSRCSKKACDTLVWDFATVRCDRVRTTSTCILDALAFLGHPGACKQWTTGLEAICELQRLATAEACAHCRWPLRCRSLSLGAWTICQSHRGDPKRTHSETTECVRSQSVTKRDGFKPVLRCFITNGKTNHRSEILWRLVCHMFSRYGKLANETSSERKVRGV